MKMNDSIFAKLREATQILQTSGPGAATEAIKRALQGGAADTASPAERDAGLTGAMPDGDHARAGKFQAFSETASELLKKFRNRSDRNWTGVGAREPVQDVEPEIAGNGKFLNASCTNQAGTRAYKLYVPACYSGQPLPLIVMLHGCKQNPDDFAAGTGMNRIAEEGGCFVAYPAQAQSANGSNCWNWFNKGDQQRDRGEPSIIADITRDIMRNYRIDASRVYIAGLSAGGAMAAVMGQTYPELYAAIGIHSGLPYGAAHNVPSAFAAMKNGTDSHAARARQIPVIVFHGDRDATVHPRNGDQVLAQCSGGESASDAVTLEKGQAPGGKAYTRTVRRDAAGKAIAEHWVVQGAGHAWSGGSSKGSYTDPAGPNASREMQRFFYLHARPAQ